MGGTPRRKKKAVHKTAGQDDKRLQNTLRRLGVNTIPGIEEVNIFKDDNVVHFMNPKHKKLQDLLPGIIPQLGPDNLNNLKKIAEQFQKQEEAAGAAKDEDIPEVENFEAANN